MNLKPKKKLAVKVLGVGAERIKFNSERINEIKEAITRQDIKELVKSGAIEIISAKGRKKIVKRTTRRRAGKVKKKIKNRKQNYVKLTRKLRRYIKELKSHGGIEEKKYLALRNSIKNSEFRSKQHLKELLK
ncbi:hypothetical protein J4463_01990 [Candidatus Pacearchaeota archaeon]|nr:hypothetical protein [Candidatus Pacearchaeota archaeon]